MTPQEALDKAVGYLATVETIELETVEEEAIHIQMAQTWATVALALVLQTPQPEEVAAAVLSNVGEEETGSSRKLLEIRTILTTGMERGPRNPAMNHAMDVIERQDRP